MFRLPDLWGNQNFNNKRSHKFITPDLVITISFKLQRIRKRIPQTKDVAFFGNPPSCAFGSIARVRPYTGLSTLHSYRVLLRRMNGYGEVCFVR
ncbi:MAG: hypothetical protein FWH18_02340 [Marinilabiliaceae bacterium]|nr:hypothetical protein [Marinilabiliaceae bacterium]